MAIVWRKSGPSYSTYYFDNDEDGYGVSDNSRQLPWPEGKYTAVTPGDCNDDEATVHPGALEICDGKDNDCDNETDENCSPCT
ncbi:MAG: putative metal-binding motif-containing protein, partial [Thermoplasmata archaeon]